MSALAAALGFWRPRSAGWTILGLVAGQGCASLLWAGGHGHGELATWPLVAFLTLPLYVMPAVAPPTLLGAVAGWALQRWRARRDRSRQP